MSALVRSGIVRRVLLVSAVCVAPVVYAQQEKKPAPQTQPDPSKGAAPKNDAEMDAAMAAMTPGPIHAKLAKLAGEWEVTSRFEMAGQDPVETKGAATIKSELGGRFLHETASGEMMGMPTQEFKQWGYNNGSKKFEAVWSWTMSTGFLYMSGQSKDDGATIDWTAWYDDETGKKEEMKAQTTITDENQFKTKLFGGTMPDGSAGPTMIITYTRKKAG